MKDASEFTNSVYRINRGVNASAEFYGIKGQYLGYLGGGLIVAFLVFVSLHMIGISIYLNAFLMAGLMGGVYAFTSNQSKKYGTQGLARKRARQSSRFVYRCSSRKVFYTLAPKRK